VWCHSTKRKQSRKAGHYAARGEPINLPGKIKERVARGEVHYSQCPMLFAKDSFQLRSCASTLAMTGTLNIRHSRRAQRVGLTERYTECVLDRDTRETRLKRTRASSPGHALEQANVRLGLNARGGKRALLGAQPKALLLLTSSYFDSLASIPINKSSPPLAFDNPQTFAAARLQRLGKSYTTPRVQSFYISFEFLSSSTLYTLLLVY
jgi:hypothetical protein